MAAHPKEANERRDVAGLHHVTALAAALGTAALAGCVVYEPVPAYSTHYPGGSNFDRAWNAALGGAQDAGVQVKSTDAANGLIYGSRNGTEVFVTVARQHDGTVRVQFNSKGPKQDDPELAQRFSRAFDQRMGR
jgi:hypothetical protein